MTEQITDLALDHILEVSNYRSEYPAEHITALAESMTAHGFKREFPVCVYLVELWSIKTRQPETFYVLISGHCRTRAARQAKLASVPAVIKNDADPVALKLDQLGENENRLNPDDLARARGYKSALDAGATLDQLCKAVGKREDYVQRRLMLLDLVPEAQNLIAHGHLGITYAAEIHDLDTNFQRIALAKLREMRAPNLDDFRLIVNDLRTKQNQCSLFDLPLISGKPVELMLAEMKVDRPKTREQLEAELEAERKGRQNDREYAKRKYGQAQQEIARLRAQLSAQQKAA